MGENLVVSSFFCAWNDSPLLLLCELENAEMPTGDEMRKE